MKLILKSKKRYIHIVCLLFVCGILFNILFNTGKTSGMTNVKASSGTNIAVGETVSYKYTNTYHDFSAPVTGYYKITCGGGRGAEYQHSSYKNKEYYTHAGENGCVADATFLLKKGDTLKITVTADAGYFLLEQWEANNPDGHTIKETNNRGDASNVTVALREGSELKTLVQAYGGRHSSAREGNYISETHSGSSYSVDASALQSNISACINASKSGYCNITLLEASIGIEKQPEDVMVTDTLDASFACFSEEGTKEGFYEWYFLDGAEENAVWQKIGAVSSNGKGGYADNHEVNINKRNFQIRMKNDESTGKILSEIILKKTSRVRDNQLSIKCIVYGGENAEESAESNEASLSVKRNGYNQIGASYHASAQAGKIIDISDIEVTLTYETGAQVSAKGWDNLYFMLTAGGADENDEINESNQIKEGSEINENNEIKEGSEINENNQIKEGSEINENNQIKEGSEIENNEIEAKQYKLEYGTNIIKVRLKDEETEIDGEDYTKESVFSVEGIDIKEPDNNGNSDNNSGGNSGDDSGGGSGNNSGGGSGGSSGNSSSGNDLNENTENNQVQNELIEILKPNDMNVNVSIAAGEANNKIPVNTDLDTKKENKKDTEKKETKEDMKKLEKEDLSKNKTGLDWNKQNEADKNEIEKDYEIELDADDAEDKNNELIYTQDSAEQNKKFHFNFTVMRKCVIIAFLCILLVLVCAGTYYYIVIYKEEVQV